MTQIFKLIGIIGITICFAGCGKAKITSDCDLSGGGDYTCTYKNTGSTEGSICEHMVFESNPPFQGATKFSDAVIQTRFTINLGLCQLRQVIGQKCSPDSFELPDSDKKIMESKRIKAWTAMKTVVSSSGKNLSDYIKQNRLGVAQIAFGLDGKGISQEICSGIVKAGDVRQQKGTVTFSSEDQQQLAPSSACNHGSVPWSDVCGFTTITVDNLDAFLKKNIESAKTFEEIFSETKMKAEAGDAEAQYNIGVMYDHGDGVQKDVNKSFEWHLKSANQGNVKAQFHIGTMYYSGLYGVPNDTAKAFDWFQKAATQGADKAQYQVGRMYADGDGVPKDVAKASEWYKKAAAQGNSNAKDDLAKLSH